MRSTLTALVAFSMLIVGCGVAAAQTSETTNGTEATVLRGHENWVRSATFSPDGARIVTASVDRTARIWDAGTGAEITVLRGLEGWALSAAFSPDGARMFTSSNNGTVRIWNY